MAMQVSTTLRAIVLILNFLHFSANFLYINYHVLNLLDIHIYYKVSTSLSPLQDHYMFLNCAKFFKI